MGMLEFAYTARSLDGQNVVGSITAASQREAMAALSERSLFPLTVEDRAARFSWSRLLPQRRVKAEVLAGNLSQLADLLHNGVPLLESLTILSEQADHPVLDRVFADVRGQVSEGVPLDEAMARHPDVFSELMISMVRAGLEGAFLEEALKRVASFLELQDELKSRVVGALTYPAFLAVAGLLVTLVLIVFFVPRFEPLFERLERTGTGLPLPTVILLATRDIVIRYGLLLAAAVAGVVALARKALRTDKGHYWTDRWKLRLPLIGPVFHSTAISRFCRVLGTLLRNGVPILKALEISSASAGNRILAEAILASAENISAGESLSRPLTQSGMIPRSVMAMIRVAEESNNLDHVLINVADVMDRKVERQLGVMVRLVEPLMLVLIGGVVMFILAALLLPVFEMSSVVS